MFGKVANFILLISCLQFTFGMDYFDYSEVGRDNPFSYLWNNQNNVNQGSRRRSTCTAFNNVGNNEGDCMKAVQCRYNNGIPMGRGNCSYWNTCCVFEKTANQTSDARVTYFVNPHKPRRSLRQNHRMTVKLANKNVCQIRVDIISMNLEPATLSTDMNMRTCTKDNFFIETIQRYDDIPEICGTNNDQHFYVHLHDNQYLNNAITLNVDLDSDTGLSEPSWNIKVTQLECPGYQKPYDLTQKSSPNQAAEDFEHLAPNGCLQYFTEPNGTVKSFGYVSKTNTVLNTNQDYAICFKRLPNSCGITATEVNLAIRSTSSFDGCTDEYLYAPEKDSFCTSSTTTFTVEHPDPLYVHFHSDSMLKEATSMAYGFEFKYMNNVKCKKN